LQYQFNRAELILRNALGNSILFRPLDEPEKIKSIEGLNYVWSEEATDLTFADYQLLRLYCRGKVDGISNRLFFTFNPSDYNSWLRPLTENPPVDVDVFFSTYKDNLFCPPEYSTMLERLIEEDDTYYQIYVLNHWAALKALIYSKWDEVADFPAQCEYRIFGLDFGFASSECALIECRQAGSEVWEREHIYELGLTTPQLIDRLRGIMTSAEWREVDIIADSARPDDIEEISQAGFNIYPCAKGEGSVEHSIDIIRRLQIHHVESPNLTTERRGYKYKTDKNGHVLPTPVKFKDHLMDAERYALALRSAEIAAPVLYGVKEEVASKDFVVSKKSESGIDRVKIYSRAEVWQ
jgi:phage terminase large subunit